MNYSPELEEVSRIGDALLNVKHGGLKTLEKYILEPLQKEAFETFKKVNPSETAEVIQTQMMSKVIDKIRSVIDSKIEAGRLAKHDIAQSTPTEETSG